MKPSDETRPTSTEAHRHACEVRLVLTWPKEARQRYYAAVAKARGTAAANALRDAVQAAWEARNDPSRA